MTADKAASLDPDARPKGILVVEDDMMTRFTLASWFRMDGYRVYEAATADDAVAVLNSSIPIHLVITDVEMPGPMNGLQLLDHIKATAPQVRVIVASGRDVDIAEPGVPFFKKPYSLPRMTLRVASMLKGPDPETGYD